MLQGLKQSIFFIKLLIFFTVSSFNTYASHGDIFAALQDLTESKNLRSFAVEVIAAGVAPGGPGPKDGLVVRLEKNLFKQAVNAGLKVAIEGADPRDALRQGLINAGVNVGVGFAASKIGTAYNNGNGQLDYASHKLLHGIVGAISGQILYKDAASGALGAAAAEMIGEAIMNDAEKRLAELHVEATEKGPVNPEDVAKQYQKEVQNARDLALIGASGAALVAGQNVNAAYDAGQNALDNNFMGFIAKALFYLGAEEALVALGAMGVSGLLAYKVTKILQTQGLEEALNKLDETGHVSITESSRGGKAYRFDNVTYYTPFAAWDAIVASMPMIRSMLKVVLKMDTLPEGNGWKDQGFQGAQQKPQTLPTPVADQSPQLPGRDAYEQKHGQEGYQGYDGPDGSVLDARIHILYGKHHPTDPTYIGRASGEGDIKNENDHRRILRNRDRTHHKNAEGFRPADPLYVSEDPHPIRGLEQIEMDNRGGAQSKGGTSSNKINAIADKNPKKETYIKAAEKFLEETTE